MDSESRVTIVVDNTAEPPFLGEHGFAALVDAGGKRVLFDTGQGDALENNLAALGVEPESIDALVLSHGHYDHTGGVPWLVGRLRPDVKVYAHPAVLSAKYAVDGASSRYIGAPAAAKCFISNLGSYFVPTESPTEIFPGIWATGEIPRISRMEPPAERFKKDPEGKDIDAIPDDQALFLRVREGVAVLLGCCHSGLENTLAAVADAAETEKIHAVIGGTHLRSASPERLEHSIGISRRRGVDILAPCHCTGAESSDRLREAFPERFRGCRAGSVFRFRAA